MKYDYILQVKSIKSNVCDTNATFYLTSQQFGKFFIVKWKREYFRAITPKTANIEMS